MNNTFEIDFYGDSLTGHRDASGQVFVAVKPMIEALGLTWTSQLRRLRSDPDLGMAEMSIPTTSGVQTAVCIPLKMVAALLMLIKPSEKMSAQTRAKLSLYRREAADVLWRHFGGQLQQAVAQQQVPLFTLEEVQREIAASVREAVRLEIAAQRPPATLTPVQQRQVQEGVSDIARALVAGGQVTKSVAFARTWRALKEHFGVAKYEQIRADRWGDVQAWLRSRAT